VETGETIATAGRSGGQSESGLYFEIRSNGAAIDPLPWLSRR
jgi:septal ring factor EnvC (AmiA/AmiB activator)